MMDFILKIINWIYSFWSNLPTEKKDEITDTVIALFTTIFRQFYHASKASSNPEEESHKGEQSAKS